MSRSRKESQGSHSLLTQASTMEPLSPLGRVRRGVLALERGREPLLEGPRQHRKTRARMMTTRTIRGRAKRLMPMIQSPEPGTPRVLVGRDG